MDIMNLLPEKQFQRADDLLAFISIYDDRNRDKAYKKMLRDNRDKIKGKVCLEAGCGMGIMSEYMIKLGAKKVYAVEVNPHLFEIARERLSKYPNVILVHKDIAAFRPPEPIDLLLHEFYGQMLYDEELHVLNTLKFRPAEVMPDGGSLKYGLMQVKDLKDPVITEKVLKELEGVLVSGMFDEKNIPLTHTAVTFRHGEKWKNTWKVDISRQKGDLLYFGIEITHKDQKICQSGICSNWSYIWTPRAGNLFSISFRNTGRAPEVLFKWL